MEEENALNKYEFCIRYNWKIGRIECDEWSCHGKGGYMEKERSNGSSQGTG
jgi:hypothetical protein